MRPFFFVLFLSGCVEMTVLDAGRDGAPSNDSGMMTFGLTDSGITKVDEDGGSVDPGLDAGVADAGPRAGCTSGAACTSGVCVAGECALCQSDAECGPGRRCGTGACAPACTNTMDCGAGRECCSGRCVDLQRDVAHCGGCGQGCTTDSFCGRGSCRVTNFAAICQLPAARVVFDGVREDDDAGTAMGDALVAGCLPGVTGGSASQSDGRAVSANDGQPLLLGELLVMGGGSFRQKGVRWLEGTRTAEVSDTSTATDAIYSLKDGGVVSNVPFSTLSASRDRVLIQLVRAPSGALVLNASGFVGAGTRAAADSFVKTVFPMRAALTTRWYVVEWTDVDTSGGPSTGDTYTVIASGP